MTRLTKSQLKDRDALASRLRHARTALEEAVNKLNAATLATWAEDVAPALEAYNEAVADANAWTGEIVSEIQDSIDEKSDKWQESDKGQAVSAWKDEWEYDLEEAEITEPESIELDLEDAAEILEQLPEEVSA